MPCQGKGPEKDHRGGGLESSLPSLLLESVSALPGLEYKKGSRVKWGKEKFSCDGNCLIGLWSVGLAAIQVKLWFFGGPHHWRSFF